MNALSLIGDLLGNKPISMKKRVQNAEKPGHELMTWWSILLISGDCHTHAFLKLHFLFPGGE